MRIRCAILAIGSELLEGSVTDTNSGFIGGALALIGIKPAFVRLVPDDRETLAAAIKEAAAAYPLVITTGGLGPTFDDITAECLAAAAGRRLSLNKAAFAHMKERLESLGVPLRESHTRQAMLPEGCDVFENDAGTAMGFGLPVGSSYVISMPGVPYEMTIMFRERVLPFIKSRYPIGNVIHRQLRFGLIPESEVDKAVLEAGIPDGVECIINAGKSEIAVKLRSERESELNSLAEKLAAAFPENFMGFDVSGPAEALFLLLLKKGASAASAESCTGGLIGKLLTDIPGVSSVYPGGLISYSNEAKIKLLGVKPETIEKHGAVSSQTAAEMAEGVIKVFGSEYGISVTGIAGPGGGSAEKPVGTVYTGVSGGGRTVVRRFLFRGGRESVRQRSANAALFTAFSFIRGEN